MPGPGKGFVSPAKEFTMTLRHELIVLFFYELPSGAPLCSRANGNGGRF